MRSRSSIAARVAVAMLLFMGLFYLSAQETRSADEYSAKVKDLCAKTKVCPRKGMDDPKAQLAYIVSFCSKYPGYCKMPEQKLKEDPVVRSINPLAWLAPVIHGSKRPFYGNWCGRGNCLQDPKFRICRSRQDKSTPIDAVDAACQVHDNCYEQIVKDHLKNYPPMPDTSKEEAVCDSALIDAVTPIADQLQILTSDPRDDMLNTAAAIEFYFKNIKSSSLLDEDDYKRLSLRALRQLD